MDKSLLALLLVSAIVGMAYAAPYEVEEQEHEDAQQLIQLVKALKRMEKMADQQSTGQEAKAQWLGLALNLLG